jgi:hypothetical protein
MFMQIEEVDDLDHPDKLVGAKMTRFKHTFEACKEAEFNV